MNNSNNNIACVLSLGQSVLPVGHCLVYPAACKPPSAFCRRWALKSEFQLWAERESIAHICTCMHTYTLAHPATPTHTTRTLLGQLALHVCVHWAFFKMANKARVTWKNGQQIVHSASEKPKIHFPHSLIHTYTLPYIHTGDFPFVSECLSVCVCECMGGRQFARHLLNLILPASTAAVSALLSLCPLFTSFCFEFPRTLSSPKWQGKSPWRFLSVYAPVAVLTCSLFS